MEDGSILSKYIFGKDFTHAGKKLMCQHIYMYIVIFL